MRDSSGQIGYHTDQCGGADAGFEFHRRPVCVSGWNGLESKATVFGHSGAAGLLEQRRRALIRHPH